MNKKLVSSVGQFSHASWRAAHLHRHDGKNGVLYNPHGKEPSSVGLGSFPLGNFPASGPERARQRHRKRDLIRSTIMSGYPVGIPTETSVDEGASDQQPYTTIQKSSGQLTLQFHRILKYAYKGPTTTHAYTEDGWLTYFSISLQALSARTQGST